MSDLLKKIIEEHIWKIKAKKVENEIYTKDIERYLQRIRNKDFNAIYTEAYLWGLIYEESNRICYRLRDIKNSEELIQTLNNKDHE